MARDKRLALVLISFLSVAQGFAADEPAPAENMVHSLPQATEDALDFAPLNSLSHYQPIVERPLFFATRRPVEEAVETEEEEPETITEDWLLSAVVSFDDKAYAIFASRQGSERRRLEAGESLDGWSVDTLEKGRVILKKEGDSLEFLLGVGKEDQPEPPAIRSRIKDQQKAPEKEE